MRERGDFQVPPCAPTLELAPAPIPRLGQMFVKVYEFGGRYDLVAKFTEPTSATEPERPFTQFWVLSEREVRGCERPYTPGSHRATRGGNRREIVRSYVIDSIHYRHFERVWWEEVETFQLEAQVREIWANYRYAQYVMASPEELARLREQAEEMERHVREHHRMAVNLPRSYTEPEHSWTGFETALRMREEARARRAARARARRAARRITSDFTQGPLEILPIPSQGPSVDMLQLQEFIRSSYEHMFIGAWADIFGGTNKEAAAKGQALLKKHLTKGQLVQYEERGYFEVIGGTTKNVYRINKGRQMNIHVLDKDGNVDHGICFLPAGGLCEGDTMLGQKLALELQELEALKVANRFNVRPTGGWYLGPSGFLNLDQTT